MALTDEGNGMVMPVAPMYNGGNGWGNGFGNDWSSWIILFLIFGMFGNGFGGGFGGWGSGGELYPWMNQAEITTGGFQNAATNTAISSLQNSVTSGFGDVQTALCSGFAGVNASINGAQTAVAQQLYSNQLADLERSFAAQTASTQGMSALQSQLAQCCCDNRLATAQTQALVQSENCADRAALSDGIRDLLVNQTANTQRILDQLCNDKIDAKNEKIAELQAQVNMQNLAASQAAQTAQLLADNARQTQDVENYIRPQVNPAYLVPNPNAYNFMPNGWNGGCGCGGNFGVA